MRRSASRALELGAPAALLALTAACSEHAKSDPAATATASSAPGSVVSADVQADAERPIDRSLIATHPGSHPEKLSVVGYKDFPGGFAMGAQAAHTFRVFPMADTMVVMQAGHAYRFDGAKLEADPKAVTTEPVPKGTPVLGAYEVRRLEGSWPDALWVDVGYSSFLGPRQSPSRDASYRRVDGRWEIVDALPKSISAWTPGVFLGVTAERKLEVIAGTPKAAVPEPARSDDASTCPVGTPLVQPVDVAALSSGEVFVLGRRCATSTWAVERWAPGEAHGVIEELPGVPAETGYRHEIHAVSPGNVVVALQAEPALYVARFDGRAFRQVEMHDRGGPDALYATKDGAIFVLTSAMVQNKSLSALLRVTADGEYTRFVAPKRHYMATLWAKDAATAYVALAFDLKEAAVLLGTRPDVLLGTPPASVSEDDAEAPTDAPLEPYQAFPPFDADCKTPFVFLYDAAASVPPKFDYPTTQKAIRSFSRIDDVTLVEFVHDGRRRLGARVPGQEVADAFIAHVKANMQDEDPHLVCYEPTEGVRVIGGAKGR